MFVILSAILTGVFVLLAYNNKFLQEDGDYILIGIVALAIFLSGVFASTSEPDWKLACIKKGHTIEKKANPRGKFSYETCVRMKN